MPQDKRKPLSDIFGAPDQRKPLDDIFAPRQVDMTLTPPPKEEVKGTWGAVVSTVAPVLDFLSRPNYASAKFFDGLMDESTSILQSAINAGSELLDPKEKLTFSSVIRNNAPQWAKQNPKSTEVIGFVLDVALDPTTYLSFGVKDGLKVGGKVLNRVGTEALEQTVKRTGKQTALWLGQDGTLTAVKELGKELGKKKPSIGKIATYTNQLHADGYFTEVTNRADEIRKLYQGVTGSKKKELARIAMDTARDEVYDDLLKAAKNGTHLATHEIRERAEQRLSRLANEDPSYAIKLFEKEGFRIQAGLPFGKKYDVPGSVEVLNFLGLNKLKDTISVLPEKFKFAETVARTFNKNAVLPDEYVKARTALENEFDAMKDNIIRSTQKMFQGMDKPAREKIGRVMSEIDDLTREREAVQALKPNEYQNIVNGAIKAARLTPEEFATVSTLFNEYKNAGQLEMRAGLLDTLLTNYNPRYYEAIKDVENASLMQLFVSKNPLSKQLNSSKHRHYLTLQEAAAQGLSPEMDAALLYSTRMMASRRALAVKQFEDVVAPMFGAKTVRGIKNKRIIDDLKLLGDQVYPKGMDDSAANWLKYWDGANRIFRTAATIVKPSFAAKQLVSNTVQTAMMQGLKAFKAFDPRAVIDASLLVLGSNNLKPAKLPAFVDNLISKEFQGRGNAATLASRVALSHLSGEARVFDYAKDFKLRTALGQEYTGTELVDLARSHGILRGVTMTGDQLKRKIEVEINKDFSSKPKLVGELMQYWKHAGIVEDYNRMMLFTNGIRMGHTPEVAQQLTNKALFDYHRGLSKIERQVFRRILPFYSFQRFAMPYVLQQGLAKPSIPATAQKLMATMEKLLVPDAESRLTEQERELLPGFLIDQPRLFTGFDKEGKAKFNIFNNMTPLDITSIIQTDDKGNFDPGKTAEHSILAALSPFLKIPLEKAADKNFFTGQALAEANKLGGPNALSFVLPNVVKNAIGWEERVDPRTGKVTTYVSPFLGYYVSGVLPAVKTFIKPFDTEKGLKDTLMEQLFGIGSMEVDFKQQEGFKMAKFKAEVEEAKKRLRKAVSQGSQSQAEKAQADLQALVDQFKTPAPLPERGTSEVAEPLVPEQ